MLPNPEPNPRLSRSPNSRPEPNQALGWAWDCWKASYERTRRARAVAVRWAAPGLARCFRTWHANTALRLAQRRALSLWQGGLLRRCFDAWRRGVGRRGRGRWHRLWALVHLIEWIVVHPREDVHNLTHPLETYRRLHGSGSGLGSGSTHARGPAAEGGKAPSAPTGKRPPLARRHSHPAATQASSTQGSTEAARRPRSSSGLLPGRCSASVAPLSPVEHPRPQRPLTSPRASGLRFTPSDAAASIVDRSASAAAAPPPTAAAAAAAAAAAEVSPTPSSVWADGASPRWAEFTALHSFEGQAGEVSLSRGERLLVSSEESPEGWVIGARAVEPSVVGYIPRICVQTPQALLAAAAQRPQASCVNDRDGPTADNERLLYDGGGGIGGGGGGGVSGAAPASPVRPPEVLQAQAQLLNRAVVTQLPSGDPGADLMAQLPREARAAAPQYTPQYTPQGLAAQQASAPSSLDVLLSRNGLLQSEQGGLPQS